MRKLTVALRGAQAKKLVRNWTAHELHHAKEKKHEKRRHLHDGGEVAPRHEELGRQTRTTSR